MLMKCWAVERKTLIVKKIVRVFLAFMFFGCSAAGPKTINHDRYNYVSAISASWKRQALLNLLKTRYQDLPVFLDIGSVINQHSIEKTFHMGLSGEFYNRGEPSFISPSLGVGGRLEDRPTITYNPLTGQDFARSVLSPIPLSAILILIQSGYPADLVFRICAQSIQGLDNRRTGPIAAHDADPAFYELLQLFRKLADMDAIAIRTKEIENKKKSIIFIKPAKDVGPAGDVMKFIQLLGLDPGVREFTIVNGRVSVDNTEIAIFSRSYLQVMIEYSGYIDVPDADVAKGCVYAVNRERAENGYLFPPLVNIRCGMEEPEDAYASVNYRNHWFRIDDGDLHSKAMFSFLLFLNSFTERPDALNAAPVISIPTN